MHREIVFILQDVNDPINVGSLFRTADALNAKLILTGTTPQPPAGGINLTARGLERSVEWEYEAEHLEALEKLRQQGFQLIALDLSENSQNYFEVDYSAKVCIILGNEATGVYKKVLGAADQHIHIPMLGKGPSLNVNVAGAVVGFHILTH